ncbi:TonB-dependent siderophore receptor [Hyphomicrobium sp. CS1GBMeth3]|uniref:TonB-dependent siderophore receptor n=1 Tax=Hyphomicrobium sp. CS1GBMeth3 TaxID=1892845 RepID=UPI0009FA9A5D|nr:TonB-dependent siderophore receptor [Hyphomicrobium sp. CS1GBMeth3]
MKRREGFLGLGLVAAIGLTTGASLAQEPKASEPAAPADGATELPAVTVDAPAAKKAAKKSAATKKAPSASASASASTPQPQAPSEGAGVRETATGPVEGYNATRTATGMKTDTPLKEIPQSVSVVGAEQIRDMSAQNLQDTLRYVPGVVADGYGTDSRADGPLIRGTAASEYLDGLRRTSNYYTSSYRIDPYFMERIEVLRGPASVLYGQAPVGGIINSVSKRPEQEHSSEIGVEYGTFDFKQVKFDTTGAITSDGKWSYRLTGLARDSDTHVDYVDDDRYALQPAITYRPDNDTTITVLGNFQKDQTGSTQQFFSHIGTIYPNANGRRIAYDTFIGEPTDHYDTDVASGTLIAEHKFNSALKVSHVSRYADIKNDYASSYAGHFYTVPYFGFIYFDPDQEYTARVKYGAITETQTFNQDTNLEAKFATGWVSHKVIAGLDYMNFRSKSLANGALNMTPISVFDPVYGQPENLNFGYTSLTDQTVEQAGLYVQDQLRLGNWIAVLGMRKDWIDNESGGSSQKDDATTYRAGLMYEFASGFTPYFSYGESFVPIIGTSSPQSGSQAFDPQAGRMYELGFKYQPAGANFAINSAIYDIEESNRLEADPNEPGYNVQTGAVAIRGFEIELTGQITKNLKVAGGYSYTQAEYDNNSATDGNQIESIPKHLASMWGVWEFDQPYLLGWSVGAGVRYIGKSWDSLNVIEVPDVTLFDAMIAYEEDNWRWSINAKNIGDEEYVSTCLSRGDCFLGTARTITTGITYKF